MKLTKKEERFIELFLNNKIKKNRNDFSDHFIVEGKRIIDEGINSDSLCLKIIVTEKFADKESIWIERINKKIPLIILNENVFEKFSSTKNSQGIIGVFEKRNIGKNTPEDNLIIALENINDPGNLGTILRTCDWFGINSVIINDLSADVYNPKVLRSTMGAVFHMNIIQADDLYSQINNLKKKNYKIYSADMEGKDYNKINISDKAVIVFSNEAHGPSDELLKLTDIKITIPKKGKIESLNVSSAAAIIISRFS